MKIVLDAMGGDHAPEVAVQGAAQALEIVEGITELILTGRQNRVQEEMEKQGVSDSRLRIVDAPEEVEMGESGLKAVRAKKKSSISVGVDLVKSGEAQAFVSAGNTGACVAASRIKLRSLKGVEMPGIASPLPNDHGPLYLLDAGANVNAKPIHLLHYAIMGSIYARELKGVEKPVVGLMSVGEEDEKGTDFTKEVFALLKNEPSVNFCGNVEGHDLFVSPIDVIVCDGFVGNVVLKSCEAAAKAVSARMRKEIKASPIATLGGLLAKGAFSRVKKAMSYETVGGSPLLGVGGVSIIAHGSSNALAIQNAIRVACEAIRHEVNPRIEQEIAKLKVQE